MEIDLDSLPKSAFVKALEDHRSYREAYSGKIGFSSEVIDWHEVENATVRFARYDQTTWPHRLTYYCNPHVAKSIIQDGSIWLTDIHKMNDESELVFAEELIKGQFEGLYSNQEIPDWLVSACLESLHQWIGKKNAAGDTVVIGDKLILAMCLSDRHDELPMWREYADRGRGAALHFGTERLLSSVATASIFVPNSSRSETSVVKVCYPDEDCGCVKSMVMGALEAYADAKNKAELDLIRSLLHVAVLRLLLGHKHPSFSVEQEYRIFMRSPYKKTWSGSDHLFKFDSEERSFHYSTIFLPHQAIGVSPEDHWNALISGVTMGPCSDRQVAVDIQTAMEDRGAKGVVNHSGIPMRC